MNFEALDRKEESLGYLVIRVSTARGAIPLEGASVSVRGGSPETSGIIYSMVTNQDGLTEKIALPAPAISLSESPGNPTPYSIWSIDVFKDGYTPLFFTSVPVYASVVSVQPAVMTPLPQGFIHTESINESQSPDL